MRHIIFIFAIGLISVFGRPAQAAPIDDAKKAFAEGKAAFERGDYETALAAYQRANTILPAPNLYYNIGATYERLGRYQEAALAFDEYFKLAGAPANDEEKDFQEKLHARAEADRKRADITGTAQSQPMTTVNGQPPPPQQPRPVQPPPPQYYAPGPYYMAPYAGYAMPMPREDRLRNARARRGRAIALMAVGVPLTVIGIALCAYSPNFNDAISFGVDLYFGITFAIVGTTLWAPGAASFVKSSREIKQLNSPTANALPPQYSGAH